MKGQKMKLYCVRDEKIGFNQPFVCANDLDALRQFQDTINRPPQNGIKSTLALHPEDFSLYCLGGWEQETGEITPEKRLLSQAVELVRKEPKSAEKADS